MTKLLLIYLCLINIVAFFAMGLDKSYAKRGKWRIPENTLFLFVLIGGSVGGILGMFLFRHKTRKLLFRIGFPLILLVQVAAAFFATYYI